MAATNVEKACLRAYLVSDVHLNNHVYDRDKELENPHRKHFRQFLTQIVEGVAPDDRLLLVLNGDILDITGSWFENPMPWDDDHALVEKQLCRVLEEIIDNNRAVFDALKGILTHSGGEIVYVIGNHDGLLELFPASQTLLREALMADLPEALKREDRVRFETTFESAELGLYVEHGHRLDPHNFYDPKHNPPLGDIVNVLVVNRFVDKAVERLRDNGYSESLMTSIKTRLHDIEYLRPLALFPLWIETVAGQYHDHPESRDKAESIETILRGVIMEILRDPKIIRYIVERLRIPRTVVNALIKLLIRYTGILPVVSFIISKLFRRTHSNKFQYRMAQKLHRNQGHRLITFGHTHVPALLALSHDGYYFNTGSWKPVINLFKYADNNPAHIEYLSAEERFKKVERCGILRIEKDLSDPDSAPQFSLQTIQSGN